MKRTISLLAGAMLLVGAADGARAQSGFALKGHYVFNETTARDAEENGFEDIPSADGFSLGAEYVLPMGIGVGVTAYREGKATEFDVESSSFGLLAEANYFIRVPLLPIRPYVGVHAGLGRYTIDELATPGRSSRTAARSWGSRRGCGCSSAGSSRWTATSAT